MSPLRRLRLSDSLAESRILVGVPSTPVVKVLLQLAELVVRDGGVKDSLEFYDELSNQAPAFIARLGEGGGCCLSVHQVCSPAVRKLAVAMALSPEGVKLRRDNLAHVIVLVAVPESPLMSNLAMPSRLIQLLGDDSRRERLLQCAGPAEVHSRLREFEGQSEAQARGA